MVKWRECCIRHPVSQKVVPITALFTCWLLLLLYSGFNGVLLSGFGGGLAYHSFPCFWGRCNLSKKLALVRGGQTSTGITAGALATRSVSWVEVLWNPRRRVPVTAPFVGTSGDLSPPVVGKEDQWPDGEGFGRAGSEFSTPRKRGHFLARVPIQDKQIQFQSGGSR